MMDRPSTRLPGAIVPRRAAFAVILASFAGLVGSAARADAAATYIWDVSSGAWTAPASWSPARTTPATDDILVFDGSVTATASVSSVPRETIGQLHLTNAVSVTFTSGVAVPRTGSISKAGATVTGSGTLFLTELELGDVLFGNTTLSSHEVTAIASNTSCSVTNATNFGGQPWSISPRLMPSGGPGDDFTIGAGSTLSIATAGLPSISIVLQSGATAAISGSVIFQGNIHRLFALDADAVHFKSGGSLSVETGFIGNAFTASGAPDVVVFESGSTYTHKAGATPFGLVQPAAKVTFESGSLVRQLTNFGFSLAGRTFGDLEVNFGSLTVVVLGAGPPTVVDNLSVQFGGINFIPSSATSTLDVRGSITVGSNGFLELAPTGTGVAVLDMNGSGLQTIASNGVLTLESGSDLRITNPAGVVLGSLVHSDGAVSLTGGNVTTTFPASPLSLGSAATLTGPGWVNGPLLRTIPGALGSAVHDFRVGDAVRAAPVSVTVVDPTGGIMVASSTGGDPWTLLGLPANGTGLRRIRKVARTWDIQAPGLSFTNASAVFHYDPAELDAGASALDLVVGKLDGAILSLPPVGTVTATSVEALSLGGFSRFLLAEPCEPFVVAPATLPDGNLGTPYSQALDGGGGIAPYGNFSVTSGTLPAGLSLSAGGVLFGTPSNPGTFAFTVSTTDDAGCLGSTPYSLTITAFDYLAAEPGPGTCISTATPCVSVPVFFHRDDPTPIRGYSVRVELSPNLSLCGAQATSAGYLPTGADPPVFLITALGSSRYVIDEATLGVPCGATGSAALFNLLVTSTDPGGSGTIKVFAATARDCSNGPVPANPGFIAEVDIDNTAPPAVTAEASQQLTGNVQPPNGTTDVIVDWTGQEGGSSVAVYRKGFGGYPQYDENGGAVPLVPATPAAALSDGWALTSVTTPGGVDRTGARDFYYYVAFTTDGCGNVSAASALTDGTLNYHLGDVSDGFTACAGNDAVDTADLSLLGSSYGVALPVNDPLECIDVGPTTDLSVNGRPTTDNLIDFEDLILYSINYKLVSAPSVLDDGASTGGPVVAGGPGAVDALAIEAEGADGRLVPGARLEPGSLVRARLVLEGAGRIQGLATKLGWDVYVLAPVSVEAGRDVARAGGIALSPGPGAIDAALLGVRERGFIGRVELGVVTFRVLRDGDPGLQVAAAKARDAKNAPVALEGVSGGSDAPAPEANALPSATALLPVSPNPARGAATLSFALARPARVELSIYTVDGRRVRTIASGDREAGAHSVAWDGRDAASRSVPAGVYYAAFSTPEGRMTRTFLIVR
ncbi:MAG: putative Ig domain-containing protein [Candidatus Eiseniibacteriota bacterium]